MDPSNKTTGEEADVSIPNSERAGDKSTKIGLIPESKRITPSPGTNCI